MPKARRKPTRRREDAENARTLRELTLFVEEPGFQLGLAYVDTATARQTQLERLAEAVADRPVFLTTLNLARFPGEEQLLDRLREHLRNNPAPEGKTPAVMVIGVESLLDYENVGPPKRKPQTIFRNANIQRDAYARLCPVPIVLWLFPVASTLFANEAPDLWHWRSGSFHFTGPPGETLELERRHVGMPLVESDRLPKPQKLERIPLLHDLLRGLETAEDLDTKGNKARRAALLFEIGLVYDSISDSRKAIECFNRSLDLSREIGDRRGEGGALGNLGIAYTRLGQAQRGIAYYEQSLGIAREIGDRRMESSVLGNLGHAHAELSEVEKAIECYEQELVIAPEIGYRRGEAVALNNLGLAHAGLGDLEKAIGHYEKSLSIAREIGDRRGEGGALGNLGVAYDQLGQTEKAIGYLDQRLSIVREIGDRRGEAYILGHLGLAFSHLGDLQRAIGHYEQSLSIAREIHDRRCEVNALGNLGIAFRQLGEPDKAIHTFMQSLSISREIGDRRGEGNALGNLGSTYAALGETEKAIGLLEDAMRIGQLIPDPLITNNATVLLKQLRSAKKA